MTKHTKQGLERAARVIGCEPAMLEAVILAESKASGFDDQGRVKILFEKHKFYQILPPNKRGKALRQKLGRKRWSRSQYDDQKTYDRRWDTLKKAEALDKPAAQKATSWGLGQIMGFNHRLAGFSNVGDMVHEFTKGEDEQLLGMANFVVSSGLADEFKTRDFSAIARWYNGPGQVDFYARKIERFYNNSKASKEAIDPQNHVMRKSALRLGSAGRDVEDLQEVLTDLGYPCDAEGDFGPRTRDQVLLFQFHNGLKPDGVVGKKTRLALAGAEPLEENRKAASEIAAVSPAAQSGLATGSVGVAAGGVGVVDALSEKPAQKPLTADDFLKTLKTTGETTQTVQQVIQPVHSMSRFAADHALFMLAFVAVIVGSWMFRDALVKFRKRIWL